MPHILVAGKIHPAGIALLKSTPGFTYDYVEEVSEASYAALIEKANGLVIRTQPLSAQTIARATQLKIVSRHGVGYDAVDLPSLNQRGIALAIVGDVNSVSVAEHALMLLLAAAKRAIRSDRSVREGRWDWRNGLEAVEISGKRLLIIGFGRIGRHVANMASGFGMQIRAYDPYLDVETWPSRTVTPVTDLAEALSWADAITIHVPKTGQPLIGAEELARMRPGAIVVNTARGGIVDEEALVDALQRGQIAAAGLDVYENEPPGRDNRLLELDQVVLSPHIAALTAECGERMAISSVQNVLDFFASRIDRGLVVNAGEIGL